MKIITIQRFEENDQLNKPSSLHLVILRKEDVASAAAVCDMKGNLVADRIFAIHHAGHGALGKTSHKKNRFLSGIARKGGGGGPCPNFLTLFSTMLSLIF